MALLRTLGKDIIIVLISSIIGIILLVLSFCIPQDRMYANYLKSVDYFDSHDGWHQLIPGYISSTLDLNTDHCMLKTCGSPLPDSGENIIQKALRAYRVTFENTHGMRFISSEWKGQTLTYDSYERYWHGYAVILKPLMLLFDYMDLIYVNWTVSLVLMILLAVSVYKRNPNLLIPLVLFWALGMQIVNYFCLVYSISFYIYMIGALILINTGEERFKAKAPFVFLGLGITIAYFELLCFPLITLIIPMIVFAALYKADDAFKMSFGCLCQWFIGYIGMWSTKWIWASALLEDNVIKDAIKQILLRQNLKEDVETADIVSLSSALIRPSWAFRNKGVYFVLIVFAALLLLMTVRLIRKKSTDSKIWLRDMKKPQYIYIYIYSFISNSASLDMCFTEPCSYTLLDGMA